MKRTDDIRYLKGIGEKKAELFRKLGIFTVEDLFYHLPRGLEDRTDIRAVRDLTEGESACVRVSLAGGIRRFRARNGAQVIQARMSDSTGVMNVTWFHAPYVEKQLRAHDEIVLFGKVSMRTRMPEMINPVMEAVEKQGEKTGKLMPIYPCTAGLTQRHIRDAISRAFESVTEPAKELLPESIRLSHNFMGVDEALRKVHLPQSYQEFEDARRRLAFDEFLVMQMGIAMTGAMQKSGVAPKISNVKCIAGFAAALPFELTDAQKRVINEICGDIRQDVPMNRLVQGDVGCGKTAVAAAVMFAAVKSGFQAAMMAPTEILAKQHYETLSRLFAPWHIQVCLLVGGQKAKERNEAMEKIASGEAQVIVGTHALISGNVSFSCLGLVITDEQHRFGVRQRAALSEKNNGVHTLVMTATPIPRTLSLILYGDLDISIIDELPKGRKKIKTIAVGDESRNSAYQFVLSRLSEGRQAYVICPLIEESEVIEANAVQEHVKLLKEGPFSNHVVKALHGRMKAAEKDEIMGQFLSKEIDVLVSTTVVEVGVDVPNATVMMIENAERFGLSQLHQLRGRVGRGEHQSYCILFCQSGGTFAKQRMEAMVSTNDGFKIAEQDLQLRGPGEFLGTRQHGLPQMRIGDLMTDMQLLKEAQQAAADILKVDPTLENPMYLPIREKVEEAFSKMGGVLN